MYLVKIKNIEKHDLTYMWHIKHNKQTRHRDQTGGCQSQGVGDE